MTASDYALLRANEFTPAIAIAGLGDLDGLWWFCIGTPASGAPYDGVWKPWLTQPPSHLSERLDPDKGSVAESGDLSFSVLDYRDGLTGILRLDAEPSSALSAAITSATQTTITLTTSLGITAPALVWIGWECLRVTATADAGLTLTVQRGYLATQPHESLAAGAGVFTGGTPFLHGRQVFAYLYPLSAEATVSDAISVGTFYVGEQSLDDTLCAYEFSCPSRKSTAKRVFQYPWPTFEIESIHPGGNFTIRSLQSSTAVSNAVISTIDDLDFWDEGRTWAITSQGELIQIASTSANNFRVLKILARGCGDTAATSLEPGDSVQFVLSPSLKEGYGSFRHSPSESVTRASGWLQTAHAVDLMLCLLTSSARQGDGLELTNRFPGFGNWSCLPAGLGCGVLASKIDVESFLNVKDRFPDAIFPGFVLREPESFESLVAREFLEPLHWSLRESPIGQLQLFADQLPVYGDSSIASWGVDEILAETSKGLANKIRKLSCKRDSQSQYAAIEFSLKSASGEVYTRTHQLSDYVVLFGQGGAYDSETRTLQIELGSVAAESAGIDAILEQRALKWLWRHYRPQYRLTLATDLDQHYLGIGDSLALTLRELPDLATGTRGWTSVLARVEEKTFDFETATLEWSLASFGPASLRIGRIAPAAAIQTVSGLVCTVHPNRYTSASARNALPTNDALAFTPGDYVELLNRDGSSAASGVARVQAVAASHLELSANFSGSLASGLVLATADYADQSSRQQTRYVSCADKTARTIGASAVTPWRFGEQ